MAAPLPTSKPRKKTQLGKILAAVEDVRHGDLAAQPPSGRIAAARSGREVMAKSTVIFVSIFTESHYFTLPYLRANIENVGQWFKSFGVVLGTPANGTHLAHLEGGGARVLERFGLGGDGSSNGFFREFRRKAPAVDVKDPASISRAAAEVGFGENQPKPLLDLYLRAWQDEAAHGRLARPMSSASTRGQRYRVDLVLNETAYEDCSTIARGKKHQQRICRIGRARNGVMARLEGPRYAGTDYLIVVDADMCHRWDRNSFAIALATPPPWAAISANGVGRLLPWNRWAYMYVDGLAWMGALNTTMGMHRLDGHRGMHTKNPTYSHRHFDFDGPPIKVESAFGGVAIYRYSSVTGCRYSVGKSHAMSKGSHDVAYPCEHHDFHQCIRGPHLMHPGFVIEWEGMDDSGKSRCIPTWQLPEPSYTAIDSVAMTIKTHVIARHEFMIWPPRPPLPQYFLPMERDSDEKHLAEKMADQKERTEKREKELKMIQREARLRAAREAKRSKEPTELKAAPRRIQTPRPAHAARAKSTESAERLPRGPPAVRKGGSRSGVHGWNNWLRTVQGGEQ